LQILALDSSLSKTGWAIVAVKDRKPTVLDCGLIKTNSKHTDGDRLRQIYDGIKAVLDEYPNIHKIIPIEEGIVRFNTATKQIAKARGVIEFSLEDYELEGVNISTVKAWARRITNSPGKRNDKAMIGEAVTEIYGEVDGLYTPRGRLIDDISDAIAVGTVWLIREGDIDE